MGSMLDVPIWCLAAGGTRGEVFGGLLGAGMKRGARLAQHLSTKGVSDPTVCPTAPADLFSSSVVIRSHSPFTQLSSSFVART